MKKSFIFLFLFVFAACNLSLNAYAIKWVPVESLAGKVASLDSDSITEYKSYIFYNIKMSSIKTGEPIVVTIQSKKHNPLSASIKVYQEAEYNRLNGDYDNITANMTSKLEPVTFDSLVYACFKKVKAILIAKKNLDIEF